MSEQHLEIPRPDSPPPTVHEIAKDVLAGMVAYTPYGIVDEFAEIAYDHAEALVAERKRRYGF